MVFSIDGMVFNGIVIGIMMDYDDTIILIVDVIGDRSYSWYKNDKWIDCLMIELDWLIEKLEILYENTER